MMVPTLVRFGLLTDGCACPVSTVVAVATTDIMSVAYLALTPGGAVRSVYGVCPGPKGVAGDGASGSDRRSRRGARQRVRQRPRRFRPGEPTGRPAKPRRLPGRPRAGCRQGIRQRSENSRSGSGRDTDGGSGKNPMPSGAAPAGEPTRCPAKFPRLPPRPRQRCRQGVRQRSADLRRAAGRGAGANPGRLSGLSSGGSWVGGPVPRRPGRRVRDERPYDKKDEDLSEAVLTGGVEE